jgi:type IV secretory pathway VirB2 component (pilin)
MLFKYNKTIVAILGVVVTGLLAYYGDNQNLQLAVSILTALGVYQVPNK